MKNRKFVFVVSFVLVFVFLFTSLSATAADNIKEKTDDLLAAEKMLNSLENPKSAIIVEFQKDGSSEILDSLSDISVQRLFVIVFSVQLQKNHQVVYTCSSDDIITNISGTAFVEDGFRSYFNKPFSYRGTGFIKVDGYVGDCCPGTDKYVNVGWRNVYVTTILGGTTALGSGSSLVHHKH